MAKHGISMGEAGREDEMGERAQMTSKLPRFDPPSPGPVGRALRMSESQPNCVAITGLGSFLGAGLAERLLGLPAGPRVIGVAPHRPPRFEGRLRSFPVDLTEPQADGQLAEILRDEGVDVVAHLAFRRSPTSDLELDHELETIGTLQVIHACESAKVRRLVLASSTMLYGPRPDNPNFLREESALRGHPDAHCVQNRVEVERLIEEWSRRHPDIEVSVLRHCWVMGPRYDDAVVRYFESAVVPTLLGYDPLLQFIHEEDLLDAFQGATLASHPGVFNVVGRGVLPLSTLLALADKRNLRLPAAFLYRMAHYPSQGQTGDPPAGFYDYLFCSRSWSR
jgi:UDP-glucose 4-epimerase